MITQAQNHKFLTQRQPKRFTRSSPFTFSLRFRSFLPCTLSHHRGIFCTTFVASRWLLGGFLRFFYFGHFIFLFFVFFYVFFLCFLSFCKLCFVFVFVCFVFLRASQNMFIFIRVWWRQSGVTGETCGQSWCASSVPWSSGLPCP